jgi:tetratricopeptide (TPR) repeat protein
MHLAEAVSTIYVDSADRPLDKLKRCVALARASGNHELHALASAWLTHLAYASYDFSSLEVRLREVLDVASPDNHQALSRAKLIGAVALHLCGRYDLARPWYSEVRSHAVAEGDDATVSALMHNLACMGVANLRQTSLDPHSAELLEYGAPSALHEANATASYDDLIGTSSLSTWVPILQAQALALQGHASEALALYRANLMDAKEQGLERVMAYMYADMAWCQLQTGHKEEANVAAIAAKERLGPGVLVDDCAATHSRLGQVYSAFGKPREAREHLEMAADAWKQFREFQLSVVQRLEPLVGARS